MRLDAEGVLPLLYPEIAIFTPESAPTMLRNPIIDSCLRAPPHKGDNVGSNVVVIVIPQNPTLVAVKCICVTPHTARDRPSLLYLPHDILCTIYVPELAHVHAGRIVHRHTRAVGAAQRAEGVLVEAAAVAGGVRRAALIRDPVLVDEGVRELPAAPVAGANLHLRPAAVQQHLPGQQPQSPLPFARRQLQHGDAV